jgi:dTDP-4-amino-4,6-dideoxygalactose transaminase
MGLCKLPKITDLIEQRQAATMEYDSLLSDTPLQRLLIPKNIEYNYAYYPVVFRDETEMLRVREALNEENIFPRRYFHPSLNTLPHIEYTSCPISESISSRVLCLPLFAGLNSDEINDICHTIKSQLS